jgi:hypothetical protein
MNIASHPFTFEVIKSAVEREQQSHTNDIKRLRIINHTFK